MNLVNYFVNPGLVLSGALLVASPIIIHLINRLRYRRVRFAAMEFLLASQQRNRRRILIEQLLLLLLRMLIVIGVMLLIARLILDPAQLSVLKGSAQTHHFVIVDDSLSMQNRFAGTTPFQEALATVKKLAARGADNPGTQKLTLVYLSDPHNALFRQRDIDEALLKELQVKLEGAECSHRRLELVDGLQAAQEALRDEPSTIKYVHLISDFRRRDWQSREALVETVKALDQAGAAVNFVRAIDQWTGNLAVTRLDGDLQTAAVGVPLRLVVGVTNFSETLARDVSVSVVQDGRPVLGKIVPFPRIEPGREALSEFDVTFTTPGSHRLMVQLESDALEADNRRYLAVEVPEHNPVLIIDGDPTDDSAVYLSDALDPEITGILAEIKDPGFLARVTQSELDRYQCVYMLNVSDLSPLGRLRLEEYVRRGGGLAWFLGPAVNAEYYNRELYRVEDGRVAGLFPVPLENTSRELTRDAAPGDVPDLSYKDRHPVFRIFWIAEDNPLIRQARIHRYLPVREKPAGADGKLWSADDNVRRDGVSTIASLRGGDPFMFEHTLGNGRVVTCLTSAGAAWSGWVRFTSYPIFQDLLRNHIARSDRGRDRQRVVGRPIDERFDPAEFTRHVTIVSPDGTSQEIEATQVQVKDSSAERPDSKSTEDKKPPMKDAPTNEEEAGGPQPALVQYRLVYNATGTPGIYTLRLNRLQESAAQGLTEVRTISYNTPADESGTALADSAEMTAAVGPGVAFQVQDYGDETWIAGRQSGQEVRRWLLILLVVLLLGEQMLACRLSYHSRNDQ